MEDNIKPIRPINTQYTGQHFTQAFDMHMVKQGNEFGIVKVTHKYIGISMNLYFLVFAHHRTHRPFPWFRKKTVTTWRFTPTLDYYFRPRIALEQHECLAVAMPMYQQQIPRCFVLFESMTIAAEEFDKVERVGVEEYFKVYKESYVEQP